jgi:hypothetical protein
MDEAASIRLVKGSAHRETERPKAEEGVKALFVRRGPGSAPVSSSVAHFSVIASKR